MFANDPDRGPPTALRGWLSDIYFPALLDRSVRDASLEALGARLGARAALDDPMWGRAEGLPAVPERLQATAAWLDDHAASYERLAFTTGVDRDVTEGTLVLTFEQKTVALPVAVVAERRRAREVELRIYFSTQPIRGAFTVRAPLVTGGPDAVPLPAPVGDYLESVAAGKVDAVLATFEVDGVLRGPRGVQHANADGGLRAHFEKLFAGGASGGGVELARGGAADDGRTCAVEYTVTKICGRSVAPQAGLLVLERGDSGLLRQVRVYDDVEL